MLVERVIGFDRADEQSISFVKEYLEGLNIEYRLHRNVLRTSIVTSSESDIVPAIIADTVLIFQKYRELRRQLPKCSTMAEAAYVGAVMSIDREREKLSIMETIDALPNVINVDGLYNFCLSECHESWKNLAKLANKLFAQCKNDDELYELTMFMLGIEGEGQSVVVIDNAGELKITSNKKCYPVANLFDNADLNVICSVLMYHPQNIIITKPDRLSTSLMTAIKTLGE